MSQNSGKIWPYAIAFSFVLIIGLIIVTIVTASKVPVEQSDLFMRNYHDTDKGYNEIMASQIAFNKQYDVAFETPQIATAETVLVYRVTDKAGQPVEHAEIMVIVTRPNKHEWDQEVTAFTYEDGVYRSAPITLAKEGRWDIMAHIAVGDDERYYNLKADTRYPQTFEY